MASKLNPRWQNRKKRPDLSTNNVDMIRRPKRYVVYEEVSESVREAGIL